MDHPQFTERNLTLSFSAVAFDKNEGRPRIFTASEVVAILSRISADLMKASASSSE